MSVMYVKINVIIVRQEIKINSDQIPKKTALFCKLPLIFAMPFCVMPFCMLALYVMPFYVLALCVMPFCALPL